MKHLRIIYAAAILIGAVVHASEMPAEGKPLKLDTKEARTTIASNNMGLSDGELRAQLRMAIQGYFVVTKDDWLHRYSHVGGMDAVGVIEWPIPNPPIKWKWLLRPGGLAMLTRADGSVIYLAREKQQGEQAGAVCAETKSIDKVPPATFQGVWKVTKVTWQKRHAHEPNADKITDEELTEGRVDRIHFRRHKSGAIQQIEPSKDSDEVSWSRGINVLELSESTLMYRWWSDHKDQYRQITLNSDGTAVHKIFWPKKIETHYLTK